MEPTYKHDCGCCEFLGPYREYDLYWCPQVQVDGSNQTIVARFGDEGPEYASLPIELCASMENQLGWAAMGLRRAMELGLAGR